MRLIAPWEGLPNGIRLLLYRAESSAPSGVRFEWQLPPENEGDRDLGHFRTPGDVIVDGKTYAHTDPVCDLLPALRSERCGRACHRFVWSDCQSRDSTRIEYRTGHDQL